MLACTEMHRRRPRSRSELDQDVVVLSLPVVLGTMAERRMSLGSLAQDNEGEGDPAFSDDVPFEARARFERDRGFADSPVEGDGFDLLVPRHESPRFSDALRLITLTF